MKNKEGWVYLAYTKYNGAWVCKIGHTTGNVDERIKQYQTGNPEPIVEYARFWHPFCKSTEQEIRDKLKDHNLKCGGGKEFFTWSGEVLQTYRGYWESSRLPVSNWWTKEVARPAPKPAPVTTPAPKPTVVETPRATSSYVAPSPTISVGTGGVILVRGILYLFAVKGCLDAASDRVNATVDGWFESLK